MIKTKEDLKRYLQADAKHAGYPLHPSLKQRILGFIIPHYIREFMVNLRHLEYHMNNSGIYHKLMRVYYMHKHQVLRAKTGIELGVNVAGPGLFLSHAKVVVSSYAKIGCNCKILSDVTLGGVGTYDHGQAQVAPTIGDRVFIGSGAKIIGDVTIADDVVIGANAVVIKDITEPNTTWAGIPARKISDTGSYHYLNRE